jgi:hypothetical protein
MSRLGPDPGATRKPPSWLVFEDDDPWLQFGSGLELSDPDRSHQLGYRLWTPQTNDIVNDKQLEHRYQGPRAGFSGWRSGGATGTFGMTLLSSFS